MASLGSSLIRMALTCPSRLRNWRMAGGKLYGFWSIRITEGARTTGPVVGGFAAWMRAAEAWAPAPGLVAGPAVGVRSHPISIAINAISESFCIGFLSAAGGQVYH